MLRDYQKDLIRTLRGKLKQGKKKIVAVMPTGAGKTFTFTAIIKKALDKNRKVLVITDRVELLKQAGGAMNVYGMDPIVMEAGSKPYLGGILYTAMVETLFRRIKRKNYQHWIKGINLIVIDECHMRAFDKLFPYFNENATVLGFTATPRRMGSERHMAEFYEDIVVGIEINELIEKGYLSKPEYYGQEVDLSGVQKKRGDYDQNQVAERFSKNEVYKGVSHNLKKYSDNGIVKKTLVFCSNIASSIELCDNLASEGFDTKHLDSTMTMTDRERVLTWFNENQNAVLCNVGILTKGFDEPSVRNIVLYRATQSLPLYLQMVGRGSRVIPGEKDVFKIFDFGGNIARHGYWHQEREWRLTIPKKRDKEDAQILKQCKGCDEFIPANTIECPHCGYLYERLKKEKEFIELKLLDPWVRNKKVLTMPLYKKIELCKAKVVKPYYILHKLKTFDEVKDFVRGMGWSPYWMEYNHDRFWWSEHYIKARSQGRIIMRTK